MCATPLRFRRAETFGQFLKIFEQVGPRGGQPFRREARERLALACEKRFPERVIGFEREVELERTPQRRGAFSIRRGSTFEPLRGGAYLLDFTVYGFAE